MALMGKIESRLDNLTQRMSSQDHLGDNKDEVQDLVASIAKFTSILTDEQRDFINAANYAIKTQSRWQ